MVATNKGNAKRGAAAGKQGNNNRKFKAMNGVNKRFNGRAGINAMQMFNPSQMPDNPGYMDFNEPPAPMRLPTPTKPVPKNVPINKNRQRRMNQPKHLPTRSQSNSNGWIPPHMGPMSMPNQRPGPMPAVGRNFRNNPMARGRPMPPPIGMRPPMPPPPNMNGGRFGPRPLIPPPLGGPMCPPPMGPPRPPLRVGGPLPPRPLMNRGGPNSGGPMRRSKNVANNRKNLNKNRKRGGGGNNGGGPGSNNTKTNKKSTTTKKTLSEIVNQYPLDLNWVTEEIKAEHKKKEDIENKLKGNKDDKLFAEFKVQRDKFVTMYEAARLEFIGKHPEQDIDKILTESEKKKGDTNTKAKPNDNRKTNEKSAAT